MMGMRLWTTVLGSVALAAWGLGCKQPSKTAACQFNSECIAGQICRSGSCVEGCETDRDCPTNLHCLSGLCDFPMVDAGPIRDAGRRDASTSSSSGGMDGGGEDAASSDGGLAGEEEACGGGTGATCGGGLICTGVGTTGSVCLSSCTPSADGGGVTSTCSVGRKCFPTGTPDVGVCLRTAVRDQSCADFLTGGLDALLVCEDGLSRLVDNPAMPTACACKLLCNFASCPGPTCPCPSSETCVRGVLNSTTQGACGTEVDTGQMCNNPWDYPFGSSEYCKAPTGVPATLAPIPICYFQDFTTFESTCQLLCAYPQITSSLACPMGTLCLDANMDVWGPGYKTCQALPVSNDGGVVNVPDAGDGSDAGTSSGSSSGIPPSSSAAVDSSSAIPPSSSTAGVSSSASVDSSSAAGSSASPASSVGSSASAGDSSSASGTSL